MHYELNEMNICVYCSSSDQVCDEFKQLATEFGKWMAVKGHALVYGGATGGLMSAVAQGVADAGGDIIGIIPDCIVEKGRKSDLPTELFVVGDMAERKTMLKEYADVFVVFPGGFGTLDERNLESVVATLEKLQTIAGQSNRRVGIISHRNELYERIPVQIQVRRQGEGRSTVVVKNDIS